MDSAPAGGEGAFLPGAAGVHIGGTACRVAAGRAGRSWRGALEPGDVAHTVLGTVPRRIRATPLGEDVAARGSLMVARDLLYPFRFA